MPNPDFLSQRKTEKEKKDPDYEFFGDFISNKKSIF